MLRSVGYCLLLLGFTACLPEPPTGSEATEIFQQVSLVCEDKTIHDESPRQAVYMLLNDSKVKMTDLPICDTILPKDYAQWGIPEQAITAIGGWWAGLGDAVYAIVEEEALHFYVGEMGEEEAAKPDYHLLATYQNDKFDLLRPTSPVDLAGYYSHQQADSSYVLFIGLNGPYLVSKLFVTNEPLPPSKVLQRALPAFAASPEQDFICSLNTLEFYSSLGAGYLQWSPDSAQLVFSELMGRDGEFVFTQMQH